MIKRFKQVEGNYIEKIVGQERFAYAHSDSSDFYDIVGWAERGGYQGSVIIFYDYETGNVYKPFDKKRNILYCVWQVKSAEASCLILYKVLATFLLFFCRFTCSETCASKGYDVCMMN